MAKPVTANLQFDPGEKFVWDLSFYDDDNNPIDVSAYTFTFTLLNSVGATIWSLVNSDFTRPNNFSVRFERSSSIISALPSGTYTYSFKVTNSEVTADEWVNGKIVR